MPPRDAMRWSICFAVVIAAHTAAALGLLLDLSSVSDFGVDAPVVTIELPKSLLMLAARPTDLAPGPKEEESEASPPPKEETKPPEPEAAVALPEPPKPEPPQEQKQATAPPAAVPPAGPSIAGKASWLPISSASSATRLRRAPTPIRASPGSHSPSSQRMGADKPHHAKLRRARTRPRGAGHAGPRPAGAAPP